MGAHTQLCPASKIDLRRKLVLFSQTCEARQSSMVHRKLWSKTQAANSPGRTLPQVKPAAARGWAHSEAQHQEALYSSSGSPGHA